MKLRCCGSGRQALDYVRTEIAPLPAYSTITAEFSHFHVVPGFIQPAIHYLALKLANLEPIFRTCALIFDEVKTTKVAQLDRKMDMIIGNVIQSMKI